MNARLSPAYGLFAVALMATAMGVLLSRWSSTPWTSALANVLRFPPIADRGPRSQITDVVRRSGLTQYEDYGTVRIGDVERPASLLTRRTRFARRVRIHGAARYEAFVGAFDAPASVRLEHSRAAPVEVHAPVGKWTRVSLELDDQGGAVQSIGVSIDVAPGGTAAWASEVLTRRERLNDQPDVVLISLDTVRRDQLTPYASLNTTPSLASLAREGTIFDGAVSTSSWTVSSHGTLFTGRFLPDSLGYSTRVEPAEHTLPEIFAASGYRTFGVSGGPYTDPRWGLQQGFDAYVTSAERENARNATARAVEWLTDGGDIPSFLFLNYFDAHEPLELSPAVQQLTGVAESVRAGMWFELDTGRRPITPDVRQRLLRAYRAELTSIDHELRRLLDFLRQSGRWDRTLVIVWSDHGQLLGERGYIGHAYTLDEELLRVPLIIKPPKGSQLKPGRHRGLIQSDDLFDITQALAGLAHPDGMEMLTTLIAGRSLRRLAFAKIHHDPLPELRAQRRWRSATQWAVHDGSIKIVRDIEGRSFAYDVSGPEEHPISLPVASPILAALNRFVAWSANSPSGRTLAPLSPEERERLRALGYIQ